MLINSQLTTNFKRTKSATTQLFADLLARISLNLQSVVTFCLVLRLKLNYAIVMMSNKCLISAFRAVNFYLVDK